MAAGGRDRVVLSLLSMPRMTGQAYLAVLAVAIKERIHTEQYREYVTDALRLITENTAKAVRTDESASYITNRYKDMIDPPPEETRTSEEIISSLRAKLRAMGGDSDKSI